MLRNSFKVLGSDLEDYLHGVLECSYLRGVKRHEKRLLQSDNNLTPVERMHTRKFPLENSYAGKSLKFQACPFASIHVTRAVKLAESFHEYHSKHSD